MKHRVVQAFRDKNTKIHYAIGDFFESDDFERVIFLLNNNFLEKKKITINYDSESSSNEKLEPKHLGGGYFELPNGEKVKGKKNALNRLAEIEVE
ncbi:hypothetical protein MHI39_08195 [Heyndrickxia sp. FSL K6-6286]|uniref:hypothetical protein n=1 Tax=Heyndrickxia sp. FSL K6-6286 TaxID=2921510 RepID=UPI003159E0CA